MTPTEFLAKCETLLPPCEWGTPENAEDADLDVLRGAEFGGYYATYMCDEFPVSQHVAVALRENQAREWLAERGFAVVAHWRDYDAETPVQWRIINRGERTNDVCGTLFDNYDSALVAALEAAKESDHD